MHAYLHICMYLYVHITYMYVYVRRKNIKEVVEKLLQKDLRMQLHLINVREMRRLYVY